mmetsp:Transcript_46241/g.145042  ORF Transcript_46241/g.145042 Transcript_46241/m.145042 type:complete len:553 (-) Transcript_46241:44-1702(-)
METPAPSKATHSTEFSRRRGQGDQHISNTPFSHLTGFSTMEQSHKSEMFVPDTPYEASEQFKSTVKIPKLSLATSGGGTDMQEEQRQEEIRLDSALSDPQDANIDNASHFMDASQGYRRITSKGNAILTAQHDSSESAVVLHDMQDSREQIMKVGVHSDKKAVELPSPWSSEGGLSEDYITRRSKSIWLHVTPDELSHRVEEIMRIDAEADTLDLHNADQTASPDFMDLLNQNERILCALQCKGIKSLPGTGMDVTGKCWVVLVESNFDGYISQRIYFHQPADHSRGIHVETKTHTVDCGIFAVWRDQTDIRASRASKETLDVLSVEDYLLHVTFEQFAATSVKKRTIQVKTQCRPEFLHKLCTCHPTMTIDLCQAAEKSQRCDLPLVCCICVLPSPCRFKNAKFEAKSFEDDTIGKIVANKSSITTEKLEETRDRRDCPQMVNSTKSSSVQSSDYYSINLKYLDWSRKRIKETVILVSPAEPTSDLHLIIPLNSTYRRKGDRIRSFVQQKNEDGGSCGKFQEVRTFEGTESPRIIRQPFAANQHVNWREVA